MRELGDHDQCGGNRDHRLHDAHRQPRQAHQRVGGSTGRMEAPTEPSSAKNAITISCGRDVERAPALRHGITSTSSGQPMCARLTDASADAVEREPRKQHRRDLVVPRSSEWPSDAKHDAERHLDGQRRDSAITTHSSTWP